jgi:hypothetical protein
MFYWFGGGQARWGVGRKIAKKEKTYRGYTQQQGFPKPFFDCGGQGRPITPDNDASQAHLA